jgi:hypothetical protein
LKIPPPRNLGCRYILKKEERGRERDEGIYKGKITGK